MKNREPEEFNKFDVIYVRAEVPLYFASGDPDVEEQPIDGGKWWLYIGTDNWYSISDIREQYGEPKPGVIRPRPSWEDEDA